MSARRILSASFAMGVGAAGALLTRPRRPPPVLPVELEEDEEAADAPLARDPGDTIEIPERRSGVDRRLGVDRRTRGKDQALVVRRIWRAIERRAGTERRSGRDRRAGAAA